MLAIGRNVAALTRLRDVLSVFEDDHRIRVLFTVSPGSPFADGTRELIQHFESKFVPWHEALDLRPGLAISASSNGELHRLRAPLVMLPHGAGYHKRHETADGDVGDAPYGLARAQLTHEGRLVPDVLGVSHREQLGLLAAHCPEALPRAVVIGDPSLDRMTASLHLRDAYRRALGVRPDRELVLVASTWKAGSQYDALPGTTRDALRALPADEFQVAQVLHPNIWSEYSADQIRTWSARALEAGLILVPWMEGWQSALIASDYIIGDHGSVTFYGAALGKPLLLAAFGSKDIVPTTPVERLGELALRLDPGFDLVPQLAAAKAAHVVERCRAVAADAFDVRGESVEILRDLTYRLLDLPRPSEPAAPPLVQMPRFGSGEGQEVRAFRVYIRPPDVDTVTVTDTDTVTDGSGALDTVERYPLILRPDPDYVLDGTCAGAAVESHIAADVDGARIGQLQSAAIVYARLNRGAHVHRYWDYDPDLESGPSRDRVRAMQRAYPGCHIAALTDRRHCLMMLRNGALIVATLADDGDGLDPVVVASVVYEKFIRGEYAANEDRVLGFRLGTRHVAAAISVLRSG